MTIKGTVKSVSTVEGGIHSATIARTDPPPAEDETLLDVPEWVYTMLLAALSGDKTVEITTDPADGNVVAVKVS